MKKCPKCGTVLDDSKKTCYMCGTVLNNNSPLNFGDTFDNQIGATVTKSQDNVFNTVDSFNQKPNQNGFETFQSSGTTNLFKDQFNNLNSIQYDERTALEKIFSDDSRFKSKDELNAMAKAGPSNGKSNEKGKGVNTAPPNNNVNNGLPNNTINNVVMNNQPSPVMTPPPPPVQQPQPYNAQINWGDNLSETNKKVKFNLSLTFIFNLLSFILFVAAMVFVYFSFFKPKQEEHIEFGGLVYSINDDFILKKDDNFDRYYTKGESCTISIAYGSTNDVDGFVTRYFEDVRSDYENVEGYTTSTEELKINGNTWQELNVIKLQENPSGTGGFSPSTKFKYVAMVYKGTYYDIRYANMNDNGDCSEAYDKFINSLAFKEE